jgi:hypothetical protein
MFEPRTARDLLDSTDLKYIGGVERFDLWYINTITEPYKRFCLRIHVVGGNMNEWDIFTLPVRDNEQAYGKIRGNWGDVPLIPEEADLIDTYLRCFAPWVLASRSEGRNLTNDGA